MNTAICRLFARDAGSETRFLTIAIPTSPDDGCSYPNTLCLSIVTPDFRSRVMNSCSNVHFL
jgi:hypothetical protein